MPAPVRTSALGLLLLTACAAPDADEQRVTSEIATSSYCLHAPFVGAGSLLGGNLSGGTSPEVLERISLALADDAVLFRLAGDEATAQQLEDFAAKLADALKANRFDLQVYLRDDLDPESKSRTEATLKADPRVESVQFFSRAEAYEEFKEIFEGSPELVQNTSPADMPESFKLDLRDPAETDAVREHLTRLPAVDDVTDPVVLMPPLPQALHDVCEPFLGS